MFKLEIKPSETLHTKFGTATLNKGGYFRINTRKEGNHGKLLHRTFAEEFYGPIPSTCEVHHKDSNKMNNCIMNLQVLPKAEHYKLYYKGEDHHNFNKDVPLDVCKKISKSTNTTGFFRVSKHKKSDVKQGFIYAYMYNENKKHKKISSVDLNKLEEKVKSQGLPWFKLNGD